MLNQTQQTLADIGAKYGYKVYGYAYQEHDKISNYLTLRPLNNDYPEVYFNEDSYGEEVKGLDRFGINHSASGTKSIPDEEESIRNIQKAIEMCRELNEVDLSDLPVRNADSIRDSVDTPRRSKIKELFDRVP